MNRNRMHILLCGCATAMIITPTSGAALGNFFDDFSDDVVDTSVYTAINGATLQEFGGQLIVTPTASTGGVLITHNLSKPEPVSSSNTIEEWRYAITMTPTFAVPFTGEMTMESIGEGGKVIDHTLFDNVSGLVYVSDGDRFGGIQTFDVGQFLPNVAVTKQKKHSCTWLPPGWSTRTCGYYILPPVVYWKFGSFGDAPLDSSLNDVNLVAIRLVSTESFTIDYVEVECGDDVGGVQAWTLSPSHVSTSGGDTVSVTGEGFSGLPLFTVTVNGVSATNVTVVNDTTITFDTPEGTQGLAVAALVADDLSLEVLFENDLRYYASPTPLLLDRTALALGTVAMAYSGQITAAGGTGTLDFALASGTFPSGVSLQSDGTLTGTPIQSGVYSSFVVVTDQSGEEDVGMFLLEILPPVVPSLRHWGFVGLAAMLLAAVSIWSNRLRRRSTA